ncbi:MAG: flagellar basal body P-ring formation chaperone FlgA, partial [Proteobacteria bacterium]|nr:flagellar basal body P-ring formation chaperone FlgA [Pseudomonadota bacterium]
EAKFKEAFNQFLCRRLGKERSDVIVSKFKIANNKPVPAGEVRFQLFQDGRGELKGFVRLSAAVRINGVVKNKVMLSGWVDVFEEVVCASDYLKRGATIEEEDVYLARKNIARASSKYLTDTSEVVGYIIKHNVKPDASLKIWMITKAPIVDKGDLVTILAESGVLRVTAPGKVLMKGYGGELIKVQNLMSQKEIYAKVVNDSTVSVDF